MLEIDDISRSFGSRRVLDGVSFTVGAGRMTGFVGGNGAGKTTTMRIILGVLSSDSGTVTLDGTRLTPADRALFGYMPEERGLYPKMKIAEQIVYLGRLHGMTPQAAKRSTDDLLERLGLGERANETVESLSLGNQQRAQIAAALVHDPEVLVLDEPFSGLDPMAVETVQAVLTEHAAGGAPVLFSSHQLDIVERLCDDLVVIAGGTIRASGSRESLRAEHSEPRYEIELASDAGWVRELSGVRVVELDGNYAQFEVDRGDEGLAAAQAVLSRALAAGPVARFTPLHPTLAQIFKEVVK
ncbi:ATP-binding cassette domain-containing protein [Herbiconiux sp. CPCC 203407]|uniref:ATP-binding cassette domain-containing protein n=1 Tax=Herbiconiux oxytropis TaxID=2970915 RepID=A0AA41XBL3_9MICO|nr:ATP-binding cassette domain-containing protein [Herbiconiux oxytropis]MCS5722959.1 ATP-binding cassette domain-containing protein [Herbiconiux oxytropis]MCS5725229.1 ATP-binding cassette domain-containing protein [Herbiconiux oxytropis]